MKTKQVGGIKKKVVLGLWPRKWAEITKFREWENRIEKCATYWIREISGTSWGCPWVHEVLTDTVSLDMGALWTRSWYIGWDLDDVECVPERVREREKNRSCGSYGMQNLRTREGREAVRDWIVVLWRIRCGIGEQPTCWRGDCTGNTANLNSDRKKIPLKNMNISPICFVYLFWDRVWLNSSGWPWTLHPSASASWVLGLWACATTHLCACSVVSLACEDEDVQMCQ